MINCNADDDGDGDEEVDRYAIFYYDDADGDDDCDGDDDLEKKEVVILMQDHENTLFSTNRITRI